MKGRVLRGISIFLMHTFPPVIRRESQKEDMPIEGQKMANQKSCDQCAKTFSNVSNLNKHVQIHSGVKRHTCYKCKKSFNQAVHLKTHFQIHTGEKPHKCNQCNFSSNQASNLREHLRKHTGEKLTNAINAISLQLLQAI